MKSKICIVATVPFVLRWFMSSHVAALKHRYDIVLVADGEEKDVAAMLNESVSFVSMPIKRQLSPYHDVVSLINLFFLFRKEKFDCVHSIMPKSGLLSMLAANAASITNRFHTFTGQVWALKKGVPRFILKLMDRVLVLSSSCVLADSESQRRFLIDHGVVKESSIYVLGDGSIAGVDLVRFSFQLM